MSLKLGNVAINKIFLGSTLINKVYLGPNQVYPTGTPPGGGDLIIEGFETISSELPADYPNWQGFIDTGALSGSNVTQGSFSYRTSSTGTDAVQIDTNAGGAVIDLTGYSEVKVDVFLATALGMSGTVELRVYDNVKGHPQVADTREFPASGALTLSVDITSLTLSLIVIQLTGLGGGVSGTDMYWDNLRAVV